MNNKSKFQSTTQGIVCTVGFIIMLGIAGGYENDTINTMHFLIGFITTLGASYALYKLVDAINNVAYRKIAINIIKTVTLSIK
jgi:hypothetical protein